MQLSESLFILQSIFVWKGWKGLSESQFIWLGIWVCSLCSPCSLVLENLNAAVWISIHFTKYFCLFTLFTLFTCSQGFEIECLNLNSFDQVFEFVHFVHLVHLFSKIWMKLSGFQFILLSIWDCSLVHLFWVIWMKLNQVLIVHGNVFVRNLIKTSFIISLAVVKL